MEYNKETKTLSISCYFDEKLKNIPEDTQIIVFQEYTHDSVYDIFRDFGFNQKVDNLPKSLTHLTFAWYFNQKVDKLPQSLTHLTFSGLFNQKVDNLPQSLTYLTFGCYFNQKVDNLPQSLTHLTFGCDFNKKVDKLPKNLTHIIFDYYFNQKVDKLPKNLTHLTFGRDFNQKLNKLPKTLKYLKLGENFQNEIIIQKNLDELSLTNNNNLINNLPEHIEKIYIFFDYNYKNKKVENLPITLKEIVIEYKKYKKFKKYIKIPFGCILTIEKIE